MPSSKLRLRNKRPDSSAIFKEISKVHATNFSQEDIENRIEGLTNEKKNLLIIRQLLDLILLLWYHSWKKHSQKLTQNLFLSWNRHQSYVRFQQKQKIAILILGVAHLEVPMQARNQEVFGAKEVFWNEGTSINVLCVTHKRKVPQGKNLVIFLQDALKITF